MILGCGVDIVKVKRFSKLAKNDKFIKRFFHHAEVESIKKDDIYFAESLAARFAAKEALGKAMGTGLGCLTLSNICIEKQANGRPVLRVYDDVKEMLETIGVNSIHVSLSHEQDYAVAQVILERNKNNE